MEREDDWLTEGKKEKEKQMDENEAANDSKDNESETGATNGGGGTDGAVGAGGAGGAGGVDHARPHSPGPRKMSARQQQRLRQRDASPAARCQQRQQRERDPCDQRDDQSEWWS